MLKSCPRFVCALLLVCLACASAARADDALRPVPFTDVKLEDSLWKPRQETNRRVTIAHNLSEMQKQGSIDGFAILAGESKEKFHGYMWGDSDLYKTIEGMVYTLRVQPDAEMQKRMEGLIATIGKAQAADGYLFPYLQLAEPNYQHFTDELSRTCESYSIGHLIESASEHARLIGGTTYLATARKAADLIDKVHREGKLEQMSGHPEIEMALVKLYEATGEKKYLDLAASFIANARKLTALWSNGQPPLDDAEAHGHAVAMFYLYSAATDVARLQNRPELMAILKRKWESVVGRKFYITGGVGQARYTEGFPPDYELPIDAAYCETCAAIANVFWQQRMFQGDPDGKYIDVLERSLYNNMLAGSGMSGDRFFYSNPLQSGGKTGRFAWHVCPCCPNNLVRFIPRVAEYLYATGPADLYVNLYAAGSAQATVGGTKVKLVQRTEYPYEGRIELELAPQKPAEFALRLRIPGWAEGRPLPLDLYRYADSAAEPVVVKVNGEVVDAPREKGYAILRRTWKSGDRVELNLPMPVRRVLAHEKVVFCKDRVAVERGPIVYCAEGVDHAGKALNLALADAAALTPQRRPDMLGGITVLSGEGQRSGGGEAVKLTLIPYYAWNYRGAGEMAVWLIRK